MIYPPATARIAKQVSARGGSMMTHACMKKSSILGVFTVFLLIFYLPGAVFAQYSVGTSDVTFVDPARGNRSIPSDLYYPALSAGAGAPVADPPPEGFAAVAFGHGYQIGAGNYAWIAALLAAEGCVVAVPRTGGELFPDHSAFGLDLAFAARAVRDAGADPGSIFFGRMGPRTLVMGHSMGGGCSLLAAAGDTSITAVANFAAAETDPSAVAVCPLIERPALLFAGTNDCVTPPATHQIPMYEALTAWRTLVTIDGASHCQFNSYSFLCDLGESCSAGITRQEQQDLVWLLLRPWVLAVLFLDGDAAAQYQELLAAGEGFTVMQSEVPVDAGPVTPVAVPRLEIFPNPFNAAVTICIETHSAGMARLAVYDVRGRLVSALMERRLMAATHRFQWDGRDTAGQPLPSGVYLVRGTGEGWHAESKLVLLR